MGCSKEETLKIIGERSRDNARTPIQWTDGKNAGFTSGTPWIEVCKNYKKINAAAQTGDDESIFSFYKKLIEIRKKERIISEGTIEFTSKKDEGVIAYIRELKGEKVRVFANLKDRELEVEAADIGKDVNNVLVQNYADLPRYSDGKLTLRAYEIVAFHQN